VPGRAVAVEELHLGLVDVGLFQRVARFQRPLVDPVGEQVAVLDAGERLPLAGLDELDVDDAARIAVDHHLLTGAEIVCGVAGHGFLVTSLFGGCA
jgi:hypothetical protein